MSAERDDQKDEMREDVERVDHDRERPPGREESEASRLAEEAAQLILEKKGRNVTILDVAGLTDVARHFVICSCDNDVHVRAVAENVREELATQGAKAWKTEGWQGLNWVIMDYVDVVVHVFYHETREFYKLERLWADAPSRKISDDPAPGLGGSAGEERSDHTQEKG